MNATMRFIVWGTIPVGSILGGHHRRRRSALHAAIWVGAIGSFLAVVPLLITPVRTLRGCRSRSTTSRPPTEPRRRRRPTCELPPVSPIDPPGR